ncbi:MAG: hypothetical protein ACOCTT_01350 [archaeon]
MPVYRQGLRNRRGRLPSPSRMEEGRISRIVHSAREKPEEPAGRTVYRVIKGLSYGGEKYAWTIYTWTEVAADSKDSPRVKRVLHRDLANRINSIQKELERGWKKRNFGYYKAEGVFDLLKQPRRADEVVKSQVVMWENGQVKERRGTRPLPEEFQGVNWI